MPEKNIRIEVGSAADKIQDRPIFITEICAFELECVSIKVVPVRVGFKKIDI